jgi:hypothetical protein
MPGGGVGNNTPTAPRSPLRPFAGPPAPRFSVRQDPPVLTLYGACAVTFMMLMYALESRGPRFVLAFAFGCVLSSAYGFLSGAWPFGVVELIWSGVAVNRFRTAATVPQARS